MVSTQGPFVGVFQKSTFQDFPGNLGQKLTIGFKNENRTWRDTQNLMDAGISVKLLFPTDIDVSAGSPGVPFGVWGLGFGLMCSGSEAGSYLRLTDFSYLRLIDFSYLRLLDLCITQL